jgi:hypothetical protein
MNKSRRHHYIPQFLTKHFSNNDGNLFVYDKINDKLYENNSINLFVEKDRNTFDNLDGIKDDVIEKVYTTYDTLFSIALNEITSTNNVSNENFKLLLFLAYISKWRVPQYDESFKNAKEYFSIDKLGLGLKDKENARININLEDYFKLDMQQELKRILLAVQPFRFKEDYKKLLDNSFLICTPTDFIKRF